MKPTQSYLDRKSRYELRKKEQEQAKLEALNTMGVGDSPSLDSLFQYGIGNNSTPKSEQEVLDTYGQDIAGQISPSSYPAHQARSEAPRKWDTGHMEFPPVQSTFQTPVPPLPTQSLNPYTPFSKPEAEPEEPPEEDEKNDGKKTLDEHVTNLALANPDLSAAQRQAIIDRYEAQHGKFNFGALLAGFGTAMQGKGASGTDDVFAGNRQRMKDELEAFDTNRKQSYEDEVRGRERKKYENDNDPNSAKSKMARSFMKARGHKVDDTFTYQEMKDFEPSLAMAFVEKQARYNQMVQAAQMQRQLEEEALAKSTIAGTALTKEDADKARQSEAALESITGNVAEYRNSLENGTMSERKQARAFLRSEIQDAVDNGLLPSGAIEEFDNLVPAGLLTFNSTTLKALEMMETRIRGNFQTNLNRSLRTTAIENHNDPKSVQSAANSGSVVSVRDTATGQLYDIPVNSKDYDTVTNDRRYEIVQ